jgi:hypothetical protein
MAVSLRPTVRVNYLTIRVAFAGKAKPFPSVLRRSRVGRFPDAVFCEQCRAKSRNFLTKRSFLPNRACFCGDGMASFLTRIDDFRPRITNFAVRIDIFTPRIESFILKIESFALRIEVFTLRIKTFPSGITIFQFWIRSPPSRSRGFMVQPLESRYRDSRFALIAGRDARAPSAGLTRVAQGHRYQQRSPGFARHSIDGLWGWAALRELTAVGGARHLFFLGPGAAGAVN